MTLGWHELTSCNSLNAVYVYGTVGRLALQAHLLNICFWYQNRACRQHTLVLVMQENVVVRIYSFTCFTQSKPRGVVRGVCLVKVTSAPTRPMADAHAPDASLWVRVRVFLSCDFDGSWLRANAAIG